jgi:hypothetical protein
VRLSTVAKETCQRMDFKSACRNRLAATLGLCLAVLPAFRAAQQPFDQHELAAYRLSEPVYYRFAHATRLIVEASRKDPRLAQAPLFTKQVMVSGDVMEGAATLQTRLEQEPAFRTALFAAEIDAREYTMFALALFAARLAHGFVKAGLIHVMPDTVAGENVAFVDAHQLEIGALFRELGVE